MIFPEYWRYCLFGVFYYLCGMRSDIIAMGGSWFGDTFIGSETNEG